MDGIYQNRFQELEFLTAATMNAAVFWVATPCILETARTFEETHRLRLSLPPAYVLVLLDIILEPEDKGNIFL